MNAAANVQPVEPGPWFIEHERGWPITVTRWNPADGYEFESMVDEHGELCEFRTSDEAREAIYRREQAVTA